MLSPCLMRHARLILIIIAMLAGLMNTPSAGAATDSAVGSRVVIMSAFEPELERLLDQTQDARTQHINGIAFTTGTLRGQPVVLFLSGISMVNAAMTTQLVIDHFDVSHIVFSGIAGGVNPNLNIGDVVVAEKWGQYLEAVFARETQDGFEPPQDKQGLGFPAYGMMFPRAVRVRSHDQPDIHQKFWFDVDKQLLKQAEALEAVPLLACNQHEQCLEHEPQVVVGGSGVSGAAFVDNAAFRQYTHDTFDASVLDMESAACAAVAYGNGVPFIAFRALSDLAGGGAGENEMHTFMDIAAENSARVVLKFLENWP